jgi:hypothetical protein
MLVSLRKDREKECLISNAGHVCVPQKSDSHGEDYPRAVLLASKRT